MTARCTGYAQIIYFNLTVLRKHHNSNMELVAQGVANVFSPLVGDLPATGAIARTATNIRSGARTPVAGVVQLGLQWNGQLMP